MRGAQENPGGPRRRSRGVYTTRRLVAALIVLFVLALVVTRACQAFVGSEQDVGSGEDVGSGAPKKAAEVDAGGGTNDASPDGAATGTKSGAGSEDAREDKTRKGTSKGKDSEGQDDGATANLADVLAESPAGKVGGAAMSGNEGGVAAGGPSAPRADRTPQISVVLVASKGQHDAGSPAAEDQDESAGQDGTGPSSTPAPAPPAPAKPAPAKPATTAPVSTAPAPVGSAAPPPAPAASYTAAPVAGVPAASRRRGRAQGRGYRVATAPVIAQPKFGGVRIREQLTTAPAPVKPILPAPVKPVAPAGIGEGAAGFGGSSTGAPVNNGGAFPGVGAVRRGVSPVVNNAGVGGRIATASLPGG
jgi:hypothetical protein